VYLAGKKLEKFDPANQPKVYMTNFANDYFEPNLTWIESSVSFDPPKDLGDAAQQGYAMTFDAEVPKGVAPDANLWMVMTWGGTNYHKVKQTSFVANHCPSKGSITLIQDRLESRLGHKDSWLYSPHYSDLLADIKGDVLDLQTKKTINESNSIVPIDLHREFVLDERAKKHHAVIRTNKPATWHPRIFYADAVGSPPFAINAWKDLLGDADTDNLAKEDHNVGFDTDTNYILVVDESTSCTRKMGPVYEWSGLIRKV
jgi:hypothetical protein